MPKMFWAGCRNIRWTRILRLLYELRNSKGHRQKGKYNYPRFNLSKKRRWSATHIWERYLLLERTTQKDLIWFNLEIWQKKSYASSVKNHLTSGISQYQGDLKTEEENHTLSVLRILSPSGIQERLSRRCHVLGMVKFIAMLDNSFQRVNHSYITLLVYVRRCIVSVVVVYHLPCNTMVDISSNLISFVCFACGLEGTLRGWSEELGVRTFTDAWIRGSDKTLPPMKG